MRPGFILSRLFAIALLGAATTVAVAWKIALVGARHNAGYEEAGDTVAVPAMDVALVIMPSRHGPGWTEMSMLVWNVISQEQGRITVCPPGGMYHEYPTFPVVYNMPDERHLPLDNAEQQSEFWFGWPLRCMWAASSSAYSTNVTPAWHASLVLWSPPARPAHPFFHDEGARASERAYTIPTGILPRGFALNTAFYAATWWIALSSLKLSRGQVRAWRGRCRACAYSLTGLAPDTPCPECGRKRKPSHAAARTSQA